MKNQFGILAAYVVLIVSGFLILLFTYWTVYPYKVIQYSPAMHEIATHFIPANCAMTKEGLYVFRPGDIVPLRFRGTKWLDVPGTIMPRLIDSSVTILPDIQAHRPLGTFDEVSLSYRIPRAAVSGIHYFEFVLRYEVNPVRTVNVRSRTVPFWVER